MNLSECKNIFRINLIIKYHHAEENWTTLLFWRGKYNINVWLYSFYAWLFTFSPIIHISFYLKWLWYLSFIITGMSVSKSEINEDIIFIRDIVTFEHLSISWNQVWQNCKCMSARENWLKKITDLWLDSWCLFGGGGIVEHGSTNASSRFCSLYIKMPVCECCVLGYVWQIFSRKMASF